MGCFFWLRDNTPAGRVPTDQPGALVLFRMTKKPKKPAYRVALISEDLRYRIAQAVSGTKYRDLVGTPGEWYVRDFVLSDIGVRHNIKELSGVIYEDERCHLSWPALEAELLNEPAQAEWRASLKHKAKERFIAKRDKTN